MKLQHPSGPLIGYVAIGLGGLILIAVLGWIGLALWPRRAMPAATASPPPIALSTAFPSDTPVPLPTEIGTATNIPIPLPTPHGFDFIPPTRPPPTFEIPTAEPQTGASQAFTWRGSGSRLGLHVSRNSSPSFMEFVRQARPTVMEGVDDVGFLAEVKEVSPSTVTIGRFVVDQSSLGVGDPAQAAEAFVQAHLDRYRKNPGVDFWEGYNEPPPSQMEWYAQFEAHRVCRMRELGFRAAIGAFATGTPEMYQFAQFIPAIRAAQQCGGILTLHEYAAPTFDFWFGKSLPGYPEYSDRGVLAFRYRWWYREILIPEGLAIPRVVSEAGVDDLVAPAGQRPGPFGPGWLNFRDWWRQQGPTDNSEQFYVEQLA